MRPDRGEAELHDRLRAAPEPAELAAARRSWPVVAGALPPAQRRRAVEWPVVAGLVAVAALALAAALTPPRAAVAELLRRAAGVAPAPSRPAPVTHLPGGGRLLLAGRGGAVVVGAGPPARRSGRVDLAGWSARGRFVVTARRSLLTAIDGRRVVRWRVRAAGRIRGLAWDPRDGSRVAYLVGGDARTPAAVRVVAGDGTGDRRAGSAQPGAAPAWRPRTRHQLAWVAADGRVVLARLDQRVARWHARTRSRRVGRIVDLAWSDDGTRLLVVGEAGTLLVSGESGAVLRRTQAPAGSRNLGAAFAPGSALRFALTRRAPGGRARLLTWVQHPGRSLLTVDGGLSPPAWSPDGRWIAVASGAADALLLVRPRRGRLEALRTIPGVRARFGGGRFPRLEGWCCR